MSSEHIMRCARSHSLRIRSSVETFAVVLVVNSSCLEYVNFQVTMRP